MEEINIWPSIQKQAKLLLDKQSAMLKQGERYILSDYYAKNILERDSMAEALANILADILSISKVHLSEFLALFSRVLSKKSLHLALIADMQAFLERDPACPSRLSVLLYYKGFHALCLYRIANRLLVEESDAPLALHIQSLSCRKISVDIHPRAKISGGVFIDHADGLVIGETSVVEQDVSILQEVTLGGTGKDSGDRHPKVRQGVLIGAGAKILGNVEIGKFSRIGAGSVVLNDVPAYSTAVGVPARIIPGKPIEKMPSKEMEHRLNLNNLHKTGS